MAVLSQWGTTFLTVMIAPPAIANIGWKTYIIFVVFTFIQLPFGTLVLKLFSRSRQYFTMSSVHS